MDVTANGFGESIYIELLQTCKQIHAEALPEIVKAAELYHRAYEMVWFHKHNQSIKIVRGQTWKAVKVELGEAGAEPKGVPLLEVPFQQVSIRVLLSPP